MKNSLSSQIIALQHYLLKHRRTQKQIVDHFGVDRKTVRRAIDKLGQIAPVSEEKDGRNTIYFIPENDFNSPQLTPIELAALVLSQEAIAAGGNFSGASPFAEAGKSLVEKVRSKMPPRIRRNLDELSKIIGTSVVPNKDYSEFGTTIEELTTAAIARRTLSMHYDSLSSLRNEQRLFNPYNIYVDPDGATLKSFGYDHRNQRLSPFSIDRIKSIKITKAVFTRPADFDSRAFSTENCFNGIHGAPVTVRLRAVGITAGISAKRQFPPSQRITERKQKRGASPESVTIEMRVASRRGLVRFILSHLPNIDVIVPAALKREVRAVLEESLKNF